MIDKLLVAYVTSQRLLPGWNFIGPRINIDMSSVLKHKKLISIYVTHGISDGPTNKGETQLIPIIGRIDFHFVMNLLGEYINKV